MKINIEVGFNQATTLNVVFKIHNHDLKNTKDCAVRDHSISNYDAHESVHRDKTMKITNKMHYID
jgi:hypothetical protein